MKRRDGLVRVEESVPDQRDSVDLARNGYCGVGLFAISVALWLQDVVVVDKAPSGEVRMSCLCSLGGWLVQS